MRISTNEIGVSSFGFIPKTIARHDIYEIDIAGEGGILGITYLHKSGQFKVHTVAYSGMSPDQMFDRLEKYNYPAKIFSKDFPSATPGSPRMTPSRTRLEALLQERAGGLHAIKRGEIY